MSKNLSTLIVLTFVLVLGLYVAAIYFYTKNKSTIQGASSVAGIFDSVASIFKRGKTSG